MSSRQKKSGKSAIDKTPGLVTQPVLSRPAKENPTVAREFLRKWHPMILFIGVAAVFLPALQHDFITYDDPAYVTENIHVSTGLTAANVRWAFQSTEASNWHPLTWLSHMADCQLFGLEPWGHHLTNVLLHALNAMLLFLGLRRMTGAPWRSLFVAALFGVHPLHVESVAWIAERKDVLSTLFWFLVLWCYGRWVELRNSKQSGAGIFYGVALTFFALGLMSKSMLVTLPCVLLLLDYWPLQRWNKLTTSERWSPVWEKIPFFVLSAAASAVTLFAQSHGGTVASVDDFPWPVRLANALIAYCWYLGKSFFPTRLAVFYPYFGEQPPLWHPVLAGLSLLGITVAAVLQIRRRPYVIIGWLWFMGTLVPVIGLVQIGGQAMADRYTYVPLTGLFIAGTWAAADAARGWSKPRVLGWSAGMILVALTVLTCRQLAFWQNGTTLFRHAVAVTENNWVAHANLYATLSRSGRPEAAAELNSTLQILADFAGSHEKKGLALEKIPRDVPTAIEEFRKAVQILPVIPGPHYNLGTALATLPGRMPEAIEEFRTAVKLKPDFVEAHYNLGTALAATRDTQGEAATEFETVIRLNPESFQAHYNLGLILARIPGRTADAIGHFETALSLQPNLAPAREIIRQLRARPQP